MTKDPTPTYANLANLKMLEGLYEKWLQDPESVESSWKNFFEGMQFASHLPQALPHRQDSADLRVYYLIHAYRLYGHLMASCDALCQERPPLCEELKLVNFGLSDKDLDTEFPTGGIFEKETAPLKEILEVLQKTYCQTIGIEYMGLGSVNLEKWVQDKIEPYFPSGFTDEDRIAILEELNQAEGFETFLHTKYVGQKRFSLEGAETFIPLLHSLLDTGADVGVSDVVLGMAHRGRLNVLANIMGKSYEYLFQEFEDHYTPDLAESTGDVKYHMGFVGTYKDKIQVTLSANPSHLESVDPVVEGGARALQEQRGREKAREVVPILVHGDAAVAGQGVVYETMTLSKLNGYGTKGTIHIVINNQIGFTTYSKDGRSTRYCTDIAKAFGAPVLHVNAEDPESCCLAARLAMQMRQTFGCDVFIDLMGYRKYGHNESDEPTFTQPLQYQNIRSKKTIRQIYRDRLIETGVLSQEKADEMEKGFRSNLSSVLEKVKSEKEPNQELKTRETGKHLEELFAPVETKVDAGSLHEIGRKIAEVPEGVNIHPKVARLLGERKKNLEEGSIDWATAELLAYGSLATEGVHVRLSGQDCRRGTFSHRHALYVDQVNAAHYFPLSHISDSQAPVDIFNSPLSEFAVMGFDFGYSLLYPNSLVLWEGQFGDFGNGAQIIIDQYITTSEMKWGHTTNLTLLLPHGYEGMGPEHSSARMERFLQMCADENMFVANVTTAAQFFHLLRRQALRQRKKPLIVFTPKAYLRSPYCKSPLKDLSEGSFSEVLDDPNPPENPERILLTSGKFYFELLQEKEKRGSNDVLIRIEQLYPLNTEKLGQILKKYSGVKSCVWVQEEHQNMGAWTFLKPQLETLREVTYAGRPPAAVSAAGSHALHKLQHSAIINQLYEEDAKS
ncbi:MAG: 2-oxoglutarate dehydrogenase E1 component [Simkaniaceae bacterium]|nr:2-oxoglutarate dehydrogenase E1 component [Candidatus Sacchlamyda saccharinae]